ncbi:MAG: excinuclease ABC subunit UvrC, partial [Gemmatimonadales bacterium]
MSTPALPEALQRKLDTLPEGPGVYLWKGQDGEVLYVGKAKRLRNRVRSYFATDFADSPRNRLLQRLIADVETFVVPNEPGSLILENNLIKEYRPRFNVRLKDDKSYPSIAVTLGEPFPRVLVTRRRDIPGARYFGPYTDVAQLRRTLAIIRRLYTVRSCQDKLPEERRERPCLDYYIGRCRAPCMGWHDFPEYQRMVEDVVNFLEGRTQDVRARVREAMLEASGREDYERARELRDALRWLDRLEEPLSVEVMGTGDADVVGYARDGDDAVGVLIRVRGGRVVGREHRFLENVEEEQDSAVLSAFLVRYYVPAEDRVRRLVVPFAPDEWDTLRELLPNTDWSIPQRGTAQRWLSLADQNAMHLLESLRIE